MKIDRDNIDTVLNRARLHDWLFEDLKDAVLTKVESGKYTEQWEFLQHLAYYFYQLGRIRGIQSERRRKQEKVERRINAVAAELQANTALMDLMQTAVGISKQRKSETFQEVISFLNGRKEHA